MLSARLRHSPTCPYTPPPYQLPLPVAGTAALWRGDHRVKQPEDAGHGGTVAREADGPYRARGLWRKSTSVRHLAGAVSEKQITRPISVRFTLPSGQAPQSRVPNTCQIGGLLLPDLFIRGGGTYLLASAASEAKLLN